MIRGMNENTIEPSRPSGWRRPPSMAVCLAGLVLLTLSMSMGRWIMEGAPRSYWRDKQPDITHRWCPDGMDVTIQAFVETLRGTEHAREVYLDRLRRSHQSSTALVELSCAPLVLLGLEEAVAFATISGLASLILVLLLWRLTRQELDNPRDQLLAMGLFLAHPGTVRCFVRPQTDALLALFAMVAAMGGRRAARAGLTPGSRVLLLLCSTAACFVKIHAVCLLAVPCAVGWAYGARGRRLLDITLWGSLLPAVAWLAVFWGLDLFGSIQAAWEYKASFYDQWNLPLVLKVLALTSGPLLLFAALHPRLSRGLPAMAWILALGFAAILLVSSIPPNVRFQYPAVAPLCVCAVAAVRQRFSPRVALGALCGLMALWYLIDWFVVGVDLYGRYIGNPAHKIPAETIFLQ